MIWFKKKRLFIEKPRNSTGYRFFDCVLIEGILIRSHWTFFSDEIKVTGPSTWCNLNILINKDGWQEVSSEAGPARIPTSQETKGCCRQWRDDMIAKFGKNERSQSSMTRPHFIVRK